jgi:hypothetical protein
VRFGTWNVRSIYRAGSRTAASRELKIYKLDLVGVQEIMWDKVGTVKAGDYNYFYGKGNDNHQLTLILLMWRIGRAPNSIPIYEYIQQDATLHSLFISGNCSTCFGWYFHPSSGAYNCIYSIWYLSHRYCYLPLSWKSWNRFEC